MAKFKLQTSAKYKHGVKNVIAYAGEVEFDKDGIVVVDLQEEEVQDLLKDIPDFSIHSISAVVTEELIKEYPHLEAEKLQIGSEIFIPLKPQTEENEIGKSEDEKNDIGGQEENEDTFTGAVSHTASIVDGLNMPELRVLAETSGFDKAEWESLNKKDLKAYLKGKL
jgi:hypothetical protein